MKQHNHITIKLLWLILAVIFVVFLIAPLLKMFSLAFIADGGFSFSNFTGILGNHIFVRILLNSFLIAIVSAITSTLIAFMLAYTVHWTNIPTSLKNIIKFAVLFPMLLPTVTYGFAIIYTFGKQGLFTKLFGFQLFQEIYGFYGMWLGYTIYTLPVAFLLINNTFTYLNKKFVIVSELMGDSPLQRFKNTVVIPLIGTLTAAVIQSFFLAFTDYGIPASVGGQYDVIATELYTRILGSSPSFSQGAVVGIFMLIPSVISIALLSYIARFNVRYENVEHIDLPKSPVKDFFFGAISSIILILLLFVFAVIFIIPWVKSWPYQIEFSTETFAKVLDSANLMQVYYNSLLVAFFTALVGTLLTYFAALLYERTHLFKFGKLSIESMVLVTNTVPGMIIGIAYLMMFSGSTIANSIVLIVISNIVHYFATPYLMSKNALAKMNLGWETTGALLGDSWAKSLMRILMPNSIYTLLEVASYYFISAMVTISAIIFIAGARTMVLTTKIVELQHFGRFNEIFVLSIFIVLTNMIVLIILNLLKSRYRRI